MTIEISFGVFIGLIFVTCFGGFFWIWKQFDQNMNSSDNNWSGHSHNPTTNLCLYVLPIVIALVLFILWFVSVFGNDATPEFWYAGIAIFCFCVCAVINACVKCFVTN